MSGARYGQHFLVNTGVLRTILLRSGAREGDLVVEVGPGRGALTEPLLESGARVLALEIDDRLLPELQARFGAHPRFELRHLDAARFDWSSVLASEAAERCLLVANLPYEAATPILLRWLEASSGDEALGRAVVMVQLEVGRRLAAGPGSKDYGSLGVLAQCTHAVSKVVDVAPGSFHPPPKVRSRVVQLERLEEPLVASREWREAAEFVHAAFARRRKQLGGVLAGRGGLAREAWQAALLALGHSAGARAEELAPHEILALARRTGQL